MTAARAAARTAARPRTWDLVLTIVLLVLVAVAGGVGAFLGLLTAFIGDSCGVVADCDSGLLSLGFVVSVFGPPLVALLGIGLGILLLVRRRPAFWAPLVALPLVAAAWLGGAYLASLGVPGFGWFW